MNAFCLFIYLYKVNMYKNIFIYTCIMTYVYNTSRYTYKIVHMYDKYNE